MGLRSQRIARFPAPGSVLVILALTSMVTDSTHSLFLTGSATSPFTELRQPRIQLVHTRGDQGALLYLYNVPEIRPDNIPVRCSVAQGTWKMTSRGEWVQQKDVKLYAPSRPSIWRPPGLAEDSLQTRTEVKVSYEFEGLLQCTYIPMNLTSNTMILRFENTSSVVVGLTLSSLNEIYDTLEDFSYRSNHTITANLLSKSMTKGEVKVVARITYRHGEVEVDDRFVLESVRNLTLSVVWEKNVTVQYVRSTRYCQPLEEGRFSWPRTGAGRSAVPMNPCVGTDGVPGPQRECKGDFFHGVYWGEAWSEPTEPCPKPDGRTEVIQDIVRSAHEEGSMEKLRSEVASGPPLASSEIILVSRFLTNLVESIRRNKSDVTPPVQRVAALTDVVSRVLDSERQVIQVADDASGVSEDLLDAVDVLVSKAAEGTMPTNVSRPHFSAATAPIGSGILGVAAIPSADGSQLIHVSCGTSVEEVVKMSPAAAVVFMECPSGRHGVASTIFENDALFVSRAKEDQTVGPVIGFSLVDEEETPTHETMTVLVLFTLENGTEANCSFWDKEERAWSAGGCAPFPQSELPDKMRGCLCTHLTHFAMIISTGPYVVDEVEQPKGYQTEEDWYDDYGLKWEVVETQLNHTTWSEIEDKHKCPRKIYDLDDSLELLSLISCCVSLFFLAGIFLVATLYPSWRSGAGRKLQLHLSASLALLMAAYVIVATLPSPVLPGFPTAVCVAMGAILHYSLLAAFSWTLVVAILQALRLSPRSVLDSRSRAGTHLVMKSAAFGWGMPLIPVVFNLSTGAVDSYPVRPCTAMCYPQGIVFYATVLTPVALAIAVNAVVFVVIMRYMFCVEKVGMRIHHGAKDRVHLRRFLFTVFLFVLLGLNWAVGLLLEVFKWSATAHQYIAYVFCSTATLQGTSLFFFFVGCERKVSGKISDDLAKLKRRSYDVASRFRRMRSINSTLSDKFSSTPSTP
ncbi:adhesion G protein-coupled receptor L4-like [Ischnura elegans]|uniref:adhesion G protein-coupled receptor L4-like n=1 Tax=Ischnura elegans TaxID=197161 RepID=UPI001ED89930|nr:adhesion G protein-coupled receptor L4-like [Ischnura elegans]